MRDIRLLTLYKQHYLNFYNKALTSQFTCLGYYDGFDIEKVNQHNYNNISPKMSNSPISEIWYAAGHKIGTLPGGYSSQNIGIFRCVPESEVSPLSPAENFWAELETMPFFAIGFLQIKEHLEYNKIRTAFETRWQCNSDKQAKPYHQLMIYCTYDNADLIVLLHGNSITDMQIILNTIESDPSVCYMHSIMGISENYLKACKEENQILETWKNTKCFIYEPVQRLTMHLVTSADYDTLPGLKHVLENQMQSTGNCNLLNYEKFTCLYTVGHESINLVLPDTDIRSLLVLLLPEGFVTHQNPMYEKGVYNISTSIEIVETEWNHLETKTAKIDPSKKSPSKPPDHAYWCRILIQQYEKKLATAMTNGEEGLASYYQALIQTLIMLDQYENFKLASTMFYLLFPAFDMFDKQFIHAMDNIKNQEQMGILKESLCQFLGFVNSVIYHTVHTDQVYLMIPGYSGSSFSIPIKLNLMYLWFISKITDVLNDGGHKYCFILTPEMESRPMTRIIDMQQDSRDRLVCVKLSQRTLYLPRYLMIILAHEIAHYVGDSIRNRNSRLEHIVKTLAYFIAEGIVPDSDSDFANTTREANYYNAIKNTIKEDILNNTIKALKTAIKQQCPTRDYYIEDIKDILNKECIYLLSSQNSCVYKAIWNLSDNITERAWYEEDYRVNDMKYIYKVQQHFDDNRSRLLISGYIEKIFPELIRLYREVFSDIAAVTILDCKENDFKKSFFASEGKPVDESNTTSERKIRELILSKVIFKCGSIDDNSENLWCVKDENGNIDMLKSMYSYVWLKSHLTEYAEECHKTLRTHIDNDHSHKTIANEVKYFYRLFIDDFEYSCYDIYNQIITRVYDYTSEIEKIYLNKLPEKNTEKNTSDPLDKRPKSLYNKIPVVGH